MKWSLPCLKRMLISPFKFLSQVPKNRTDLLPHYSRLVATLNRYMPDLGTELVGVVSTIWSSDIYVHHIERFLSLMKSSATYKGKKM